MVRIQMDKRQAAFLFAKCNEELAMLATRIDEPGAVEREQYVRVPRGEIARGICAEA